MVPTLTMIIIIYQLSNHLLSPIELSVKFRMFKAVSTLIRRQLAKSSLVKSLLKSNLLMKKKYDLWAI